MDSLENMLVLLLAAVIAVPLFKRAGLGAVLGYLGAGMLIGPSGLALFSNVEDMLHFAEFGVVLLLFIIGLELQPSRLRALRRPIFGIGGLQVVLCATAVAAVSWLAYPSTLVVFVIGAGLALSSTAFVLQLLAEKKQLTASHGRLAFTILLFQDLAVIPILALLPQLAGDSGTPTLNELMLDLLRIGAIFAVIILVGRLLLRHILRFINATRVREISIAAALLVVTGVAYLMSEVGLSMALGSFMAGVLLADSEYRHQLEADIEPFKGLLLGLFFLSVGMTLNIDRVIAEPLLLVGLALGLMVTKTAIVFLIGRWAGGLDNDGAWRLGLLLSQGGEFGFVVFALAGRLEVLPPVLREQLVVVVTLSMILTPLLYSLYERVFARWVAPSAKPYDTIDESEAHVLIAGFGRFGQIAGRLLNTLQVPFTALDISPDQVDVVRRFGNKVHYGDAAQLDVLRAAGLAKARVLVLAIDDVEASLRTAEIVRQYFPQVKVLARARNRRHAHRLMDTGVEWIVRETFLSALHLAEQLLVQMGNSTDEARDIIRIFREADERNLIAQHGIHHDQQKIIQSAREAADELRRLFEHDRAAREVER